MFKELKDISRQFIIYGIGGLMTRAIGFILLPFYTHYIVPAEYGVMALVDMTGYLVGVFVMFEVSSAFMKFYYDSDTAEQRSELIATTHFLVALSGIVVLGVLQYFAEDICSFVIGDVKYTVLFRLLFVSLLFNGLSNIFQSNLRAEEKSTKYLLFELSRTFLALVLNIYFVAFMRLSILGIFLSTTIVSVIYAIPCTLWLMRGIWTRVSGHYLKEMVLFALPMVPSGLFELTFHYSDRFFLKTYSTMEQVGIYSVAGKFSMILGILIAYPFRLMWSAKLFDLSKKEGGMEIQQKVLTYLLFASFFVALSISIPIKEVIRLLLPSGYQEASRFIPIVLLGISFYSLNWIFKGGLLIKKRTGLISVVAGVTAALNILFNWFLVRPFGAIGAAWAISISYFSYSAIMFAVSYRYYPVTYETARMVKLVMAAAIVYAGSRLLPETALALDLAIKAALVLTFPLLLYFMNFYDRKEKDYISRAVYALRP